MECGRRLGAATEVLEHHAQRSRPEVPPTFMRAPPQNLEPRTHLRQHSVAIEGEEAKIPNLDYAGVVSKFFHHRLRGLQGAQTESVADSNHTLVCRPAAATYGKQGPANGLSIASEQRAPT